MDLKLLNQLFSFRDIRNGILGTIVVVGGIGLAIMTLWASQTDPRLAGILAGVSLVFVLLILIFIVPPLARNAGREASQMNLPFEVTGGGAIMSHLSLRQPWDNNGTRREKLILGQGRCRLFVAYELF